MALNLKKNTAKSTPPKKDQRSESFINSILGESTKTGKNNPYSHYLSRSVLLEESSPPKNVRATINISLGMLLSFIVWASITQLDERASAPGDVSPVGFIMPVQHPEGGVINQLLVSEGDYVEANQILVVLNDVGPIGEYEAVKVREASLSLNIERLRAFTTGRLSDFRRVNEDYPEIISDQEQLLAAQISAREAQVSVINAQIQELREERDALDIQEITLLEQVDLMQQEANIRQTLLDRGLTSKLVYIEAQKDLSEARGELAQNQSAKARADSALAEANRRVLELEERLRNDALSELASTVEEQAQVFAQLARLEERVEKTAIRAPKSGVINKLVIRPEGGVLLPGELLAEVVPTGEEMVANIRVSPKDIGHIEVGDEVLVKIETFNYARWGGIKGRLSYISASSFTEPAIDEGQPFFRARVILEKNYVGQDPKSNHITPSMTLVADIKTGEKSLMAYLIRPIYNTLTQSFSER